MYGIYPDSIFGRDIRTETMILHFKDKYRGLGDREIVVSIISQPYDEEAAAYLIHNRYDPLFRKIYNNVFGEVKIWYGDCLGDLFDYLKGKDGTWNKLRTFSWRSSLGTWLGVTARRRFIEIKPLLIGNPENSVSIDDNQDGKIPVCLPDNGEEEYERQQNRIILREAVAMLEDDQKFVVTKRLQGYSSSEIAKMMQAEWERKGIRKYDNKGNVVVPTPGYVDVRYQRAKENLRNIIMKL